MLVAQRGSKAIATNKHFVTLSKPSCVGKGPLQFSVFVGYQPGAANSSVRRTQMNHLSRSLFIAIACLVGLVIAVPRSYADQSIYKTNFEAPPFVAGSPLVGQDDWTGVSNIPLPPFLPPCSADCLSPNAAVVSTAKPRQGKQS